MDDLIARVAAAAGIDPAVARQAIAQIFAFLQTEGPPEDVAGAFAKMPGATDLAAEAGAASGGGLMGMLGGLMGGGGLMGLAGKLSGLGLGMGEMQSVGREIFAYTREQGAEEEIGRIAANVPGLSQFV